MKIRIFAFVLALTVMFGSVYAPEKVYAAEEDYQFTILGQTLDLTEFCTNSNYTHYLDGMENPSYLLMMTNNDVINNRYVYRLFYFDKSISKNLILKFNKGSLNAWGELYSAPLITYSFCTQNLDGSFDETECQGVYRLDFEYLLSDNSLKVTGNVQPVYSSTQTNLYPENLIALASLSSSAPPAELLPLLFDGNVTVSGAEYANGTWSINSVFLQPLPRTILTKVAKGITMDPMKQILRVLPMGIAFLVGCVGLRKALAILERILHQA